MYLHYIMPDSVTPKQNTLNHNIGFSNLRCKKRVFLKWEIHIFPFIISGFNTLYRLEIYVFICVNKL